MSDLREAALNALQKIDRACRHHRELVDASKLADVQRLGRAVEHDWYLLEDAAQQLREALNIEGELK